MNITYGTLTLITGPMFAGKTSEILKRILWSRNGLGQEVIVLKPAFDNRYAETQIVSHNGLKAEAVSIAYLPMTHATREAGDNPLLVVLDEVQFFTADHIAEDDPCGYYAGSVDAWVREMLALGHDVVAAGLDMDWQGVPFPVTANLASMADEVMKLHAHCTVCGKPARKTYKISQDGTSVALGASESYEARCNTHWHDHSAH